MFYFIFFHYKVVFEGVSKAYFVTVFKNKFFIFYNKKKVINFLFLKIRNMIFSKKYHLIERMIKIKILQVKIIFKI